MHIDSAGHVGIVHDVAAEDVAAHAEEIIPFTKRAVYLSGQYIKQIILWITELPCH